MLKNMKKFAIIFILLINVSYANEIYSQEKLIQIQKAQDLSQYYYDLQKMNEILNILYNSEKFKNITTTAEDMNNLKTSNGKYSYEYIEMLIKLLNGINPNNDIIGYYDKNKDIGGGYIKFIQDKNKDYSMFLLNKNNVIKNFDVIENRIKQQLKILNPNNNVKKNLKVIFHNLIFALNEIKIQTDLLKKEGIIKPFTKYDDYRYLMPYNLAQIDGKTTLSDIINFILNYKNRTGIKVYYLKFYRNDFNSYSILY